MLLELLLWTNDIHIYSLRHQSARSYTSVAPPHHHSSPVALEADLFYGVELPDEGVELRQRG